MRLTEDRELRRRRLAVLLRLILVVPAALAAAALALVAVVLAPFAWLAALVRGQVPLRLHEAVVAALGYVVQVTAWTVLVTARYPWPQRLRTHPVQLTSARERQRRWTVLLRVPLALPTLVLASVFLIVLLGTAIGAWFAGLALGRTREGLWELGAFCLRYVTDAAGYLMLVTPRYPPLASPPPMMDDTHPAGLNGDVSVVA